MSKLDDNLARDIAFLKAYGPEPKPDSDKVDYLNWLTSRIAWIKSWSAQKELNSNPEKKGELKMEIDFTPVAWRFRYSDWSENRWAVSMEKPSQDDPANVSHKIIEGLLDTNSILALLNIVSNNLADIEVRLAEQGKRLQEFLDKEKSE